MTDKQFYVFVERNDNEGETWCFYVPLTEAEFDHLQDVLDNADDQINETYSISGPIAEEHVDILIQYGNEAVGYFDPHTKCVGAHNVFEIEVGCDNDELMEILYKGQYWKTK